MKKPPIFPLPESFLFGVGTADHQCEAYDPRYEDIRDVWERRLNQTPRGRATDFWHRYPEDITLAQSVGCQAFRFSLAWSRLEPEPGQWNEEAFQHYQTVINTIQAAGMEPIVTLHHFTWPIHIEARGGFLSPDFPTWFAQYTDEVVRRIGKTIRYWITFNEPNQLIYGYIKPWWQPNYFMPPGLPAGATFDEQMDAVGQVIQNLFLAHTTARQVIKNTAPDAKVGVNPLLLGLPTGLQKLVDRNITNLKSREDWLKIGRRFTERTLLEKIKVDLVIATLTKTTQRMQDVDFSDVYYTAGQILLVKASSSLQDSKQLEGKIIVVLKGSTAENTVRRLFPEAFVREVETTADALKLLNAQQVDAWLEDDSILRGILNQYPNQYRFLGELLTEEFYAAAVSPGNPELLEAVDTAIQCFITSGEWAKSHQTHFPNQPLPELPQPNFTLTDINSIQFKNSEFYRCLDQPLPLAPANTWLRQIQNQGYLTVGVENDVPGFSYFDPKTKEWNGLEIDLAKAIARHIFGDENQIKFYPITTQQRLPILKSLLQAFDPIFQEYSIISSIFTSNWWHLGMAGKLPTFLCPAECIGQQDFVGFDYYWGVNSWRPNKIKQLWNGAIGRFDQAPVWPEGLYQHLKFNAKLFPDQEIWIVENGCVDQASGVSRVNYLKQHIQQIQQAVAEGVKVKGYIYWSLTSNREWGHEFSPGSDFGLYHINLDDDPELKRIPTAAVEAYRQIIQHRGV